MPRSPMENFCVTGVQTYCTVGFVPQQSTWKRFPQRTLTTSNQATAQAPLSGGFPPPKKNGRQPPPDRGGLPLSNPELVWEHFFFRSKLIYHGEAPNKTPLAIVLPITQTIAGLITNPWRFRLLGYTSPSLPMC